MSSPRGQFQAVVAANVPLCREHFRLVLRLQAFPATQPGQFIQVACRDLGDPFAELPELDWEPGTLPHLRSTELALPSAMLRRPFSLADRRDLDGSVELDVIHRIVGVGTDWLARLTPGDAVHILGPLGNHFELPPKDGIALLIGGGVGIPPMMYLAGKLNETKSIAFAGAVSRDLLALTITDDAPAPSVYDIDPLYNIAEFARHGIPAIITTDDGSYGFRGFITQALEAYLDKYFKDDSSPILYTCGPEPMMRRVMEIAARRSLRCQVAVERAMACGMGTCQSCCIKIKKPDPGKPPLPGRDWAYRLACTDGPVFEAASIVNG